MRKYMIIKSGDKRKKEVFLTFDDGPNPYSTGKILDILDKYNAKATFFVIGKRCLEHKEILKDIVIRGHMVGNHSFSHLTGDFNKCSEIIKDITGIEVKIIRPPFYDLSFL